MKRFAAASRANNEKVITAILKGIATVFLATTVVPGFAVTIPVMTGYFDTAHFDSINGEGITYISSSGNYAIVDSSDDTVYIVDSKGRLQNSFDVSARTTNPSGIAFNPVSGLLAVTDDSADEVFYFDLSGNYQSQFDTTAIGSSSPQGITYNPVTGNFAIVDSATDAIFFVNPAGVLQGSCVLGGILNPLGIAYLPDTGDYAVANSSTSDLHIVDSSCLQQDQFDTAFVAGTVNGTTWNPNTGDHVVINWNSGGEAFFINADGWLITSFSTVLSGSNSPSGITFVPPDKFAFVDNAADRLFLIDALSGSAISDCSTAGFSANPAGVAYDAAADDFVIADGSNKKLFFTDSLCNQLDDFLAGTFGISPTANLTGVTLVPSLEKVAFSDTLDVVKIVDPQLPGRLRSQFSTAGVNSVNPTGLVFIASSGNYAIVDSSRDAVFVVTPQGQLMQQFSTAVFSTSPSGIAFDTVNKQIAIVDNVNDQIHILDMPAIDSAADPSSCRSDFDLDGDVDGSDLAKFSIEFGRTDCPAF